MLARELAQQAAEAFTLLLPRRQLLLVIRYAGRRLSTTHASAGIVIVASATAGRTALCAGVLLRLQTGGVGGIGFGLGLSCRATVRIVSSQAGFLRLSSSVAAVRWRGSGRGRR